MEANLGQTESGELIVPVIEERVQIDRQQRETGRIRVIKSIESQEETITLSAIVSQAQITRVPIGTWIEGPVPEAERRGDSFIVPVVEEVLVLEKRLRLREEVHIRFDQHEEIEDQIVVLRREVVSIEREEPADSHTMPVTDPLPEGAVLLPGTATAQKTEA